MRAHLAAGDPAGAMTMALEIYDAAPNDAEAKFAVACVLRDHADLFPAHREGVLHRLLVDKDIDPFDVAQAGWFVLHKRDDLFADAAPEHFASRLEADAFALELLKQSYVADHKTEHALTALRRWLLLERRHGDYPALASALIAQAARNGGAWPFGDDERARLGGSAFASAYLPPREALEGESSFTEPVTRNVARQYEAWPYPAWTRHTRRPPSAASISRRRFPEDVRAAFAAAKDILVAGCGTGREAILYCDEYPGRRILAVDISSASLRYAKRRATELGIDAIDFQKLDLHRIGDLGRQFDFITSSGVLHHLPDPEAGWAALAGVLRPGGILNLMVYSKVARLRVRGLRTYIADLLDKPVDDDLLRAVRARLIAKSSRLLASRDFFTLGGVHDLLLHTHEDPFDVSRIRRGIERLGLEFIGFNVPGAAREARYREQHPDDPLFRNFDYWAALEKNDPFLYAGMYRFWMRKPQ